MGHIPRRNPLPLKAAAFRSSQKQDQDALLSVVEAGVLQITALSPGIFKSSVWTRSYWNSNSTKSYRKTIRMGKELRCAKVITFGFKRGSLPGDEENEIAIRYLNRAVQRAEDAGVVLLVENEPGFLCDTGTNTAAPASRSELAGAPANWDPATLSEQERILSDGYEAVKPFIANVHGQGHAPRLARGNAVRSVKASSTGADSWLHAA